MKVWTFLLSGGTPCDVKVPNHPILRHNGRMTVWKMVGSREDAKEVEAVIRRWSSCHIQCTTECQTESQRKERMRLLGVSDADL